MTLKEQATQNLKDFVEILDELEITFWLDGGTLLGAYRDKDFCDSDEDDTDLCTWDNYLPLKQEVIKRSIEKGFELLHEWELEICVGRGGARIDLFFISFKGLDLLAPSPVEEFLTLKYGDWRTPIHRSQYRCDNKDQNKFIRESYV